jgi:hypothetical protein
MFKQIHIFDMDGTIVDSLHRFRIDPNTGKIDLPFWIEHDTPEHIAKDRPKGALAEIYKEMIADPEIYVVIATARVMKAADYEWLKNNLGLPNKIISRNGRNDNRKGADMKIAGLRYLKNLRQFANIPKWFYEDNKDYLYPVANFLGAVPIYCESQQGV